jgi:hypothetical protein
MKSLLVILMTYLAINPGMAALGIGMGFLLHWILPAVDLGISILVGVVVTGLSIHFFIRLLIALEAFDIRGGGRRRSRLLPLFDRTNPTSPQTKAKMNLRRARRLLYSLAGPELPMIPEEACV